MDNLLVFRFLGVFSDGESDRQSYTSHSGVQAKNIQSIAQRKAVPIFVLV